MTCPCHLPSGPVISKRQWRSARIPPKDCIGSEVKQVHRVGPQECSPVRQSINFQFMLQQEVCKFSEKGLTCSQYDKQRLWSQDHEAMQDTWLQVLGVVK